jgi:RHH-type proline utilization regulon transcriptional repressor/proline dehydrogenase/delta 1-pyrroline-5-carboxylate dehydrogenase
VLRRAADLYEADFGAIFALLAREAGKTQLDAVGELREAADFLRYYANQAEKLGDASAARRVRLHFAVELPAGDLHRADRGGARRRQRRARQAGRTDTADRRARVALMHDAGVPRDVLQLLPGDGATVGAALTSDPRIDGVCFTGSTATAQAINRAMARISRPTRR